MIGNETVRYCPECKLDVYNLSNLSDRQVNKIVSGRQQRLCARVIRRQDGTVVTHTPRLGFSILLRRISKVASVALAASISLGPAVAGTSPTTSRCDLIQIQQDVSEINLVVTDSIGVPISKASVTVVNEETRIKVTGETDVRGQFRTPELPVGNYEITIDRAGFQTLKQTHIGVPARAPLKLQLEAEAIFVGEIAATHSSAFRKFISKLRRIF